MEGLIEGVCVCVFVCVCNLLVISILNTLQLPTQSVCNVMFIHETRLHEVNVISQ